eukprot:CAMPEP_0196738702 /NCGR_PEP_ID=MMETSP1091-20130531/15948_1 /TAXON_ID=302021 /ORGANISM="Rhodomonas sp., Strain CCMP768" /LENGTH=320 /DNA_ID=CAMNT_0042082681 /DNA_START=99 /DNA_END=1063 /DNA_ORIENTATION=-
MAASFSVAGFTHGAETVLFEKLKRRAVVPRSAFFQMQAGADHSQRAATLADLEIPLARFGDCWRPTADDVDRISWGKPAKKKMTGSRGVPHRLNQEERMLYDMARRKGLLEMSGSGWRKQRRGAPLANSYRSWCDSQGVPVVVVHKDKGGEDEVVLDLSPMRVPQHFVEIAEKVGAAEPGADIEFFEGMAVMLDDGSEHQTAQAGEEAETEAFSCSAASADLLDGFEKEPIYRLPMFVVAWQLQRPDAKALAKRLAVVFGTAEPASKGKKPSKTLQRGMPQIKPGGAGGMEVTGLGESAQGVLVDSSPGNQTSAPCNRPC